MTKFKYYKVLVSKFDIDLTFAFWHLNLRDLVSNCVLRNLKR